MYKSVILLFVVVGHFTAFAQGQSVRMDVQTTHSPRIDYGLAQLKAALKKQGCMVQEKEVSAEGKSRHLTVEKLPLKGVPDTLSLNQEGFYITTDADAKHIRLIGADDSGILYGCLALAEHLEKDGGLAPNLRIKEAPEMVLRGTAIGIQKTHYLPGRNVYEYPYTPEEFPWLYDKAQWIRYLDMLLENRYNSLYLWNGHPFASLVRLKDYPEALEVDEDTFKKNEELFRFITEEADKRGIWIIQMFYNIIIPKPFAEKHGLKTQDRNRPILPLIADYTRQSIAAFVAKYPNVGLLVTLGEAMEGTGQDDIDWFTRTIIPGVQDGLKRLGISKEPPIVLRAHDTDAPAVMKAALSLYQNLYTMAKYNGEALTTYAPRGKWAELHRTLSAAAPVHIENVHIMANLEPFRYGSPDFIQKSVQAMHRVYHANGLHLYPQASYWDWPYAADRLDDDGTQRLMQIDRDAIWYKAWARYAWKADRSHTEEQRYWTHYFAVHFDTDTSAAAAILRSYQEMGEIAPKLLRRYGITDGNRQTLSLGMFMTQLINPYRYNLFTLLYESEAPEGEMLIDFAKKEWNHMAHVGETPLQIADEVEAHGKRAVQAIDAAGTAIKQNRAAFARLQNDAHAYQALANFYAEKARAAIQVLRYKYSYDVADLLQALPHLEHSVQHFRRLSALTEKTYWYANSMQTKQRKIPIRGVDGTYKHWREMLPLYEQELAHFKQQIDSLKKKPESPIVQLHQLQPAAVQLLSDADPFYVLQKGARPFSDVDAAVIDLATDLKGIKALHVQQSQQLNGKTMIHFDTDEPVKLLIGYFKEKKGAFGSEPEKRNFAPSPDLEHDASANDYGQSDVLIANALQLTGFPPIHVHSYFFHAGSHTLTLPKGLLLPLGFVKADKPLKTYDANVGVPVDERNIDWLFE